MIDVDIDGGGIATLSWNRSDAPTNLIDAAALAAFADAVERVAGDDRVTGVVVTSARDDFVAGADLAEVLAARAPEEVFDACRRFQGALRRLETCAKPVVAALTGTALGGGLEIALACHHRIAAESTGARFGLPEVTVGLMPGGGGTQRLPRLIGARAALPLMLEGRRLSAAQAVDAGIIDRLVPAAELADAARAWLAGPEAASTQPWDRKGFQPPGGGVWGAGTMETFVAGTALAHARSRGLYPAVQAIMSAVYEGLPVDIDTGMKGEARWFTHVATGAVAKAMVRSLFFFIGRAEHLARRPRDVPSAAFTRLGVLGAGMMGAGIAHAGAAAGLEVALLDVSREAAEAGKAAIARLLDRQRSRGRIGEAERAAILDRIAPTDRYRDLAGAGIVIEAVFEDRAVKAEVTAKAEAVIDEAAIVASNTSTLPITGLAEASRRPGRFLGLHFFSPVERMRLVEVIRGRETAAATLAHALDFVRLIGKTPIVVGDSRGFYTSRTFATYVQEGMAMLGEGVAPALIENAGRLAGMPVGPLAVADEVSLALIHKVAAQTAADLGEAYRAPPGATVLTVMVETLGRTGRAGGHGFYEYPKDQRAKALWPDLARHFPLARTQPDLGEVKQRLMHVQCLEAVRCIEDGVLQSAEDGDVGALLGWGFPAWTGGPLSHIDTLGAARFAAECEALASAHGERFSPPALLREMARTGARFHDDSARAVA